MLKFLLVILSFFITGLLQAQSAHEYRRNADKEYSGGNYLNAEENYRKAVEENPEVKAYFNLGNSLFQQQRYDEALEQFDKALANSNDPLIQSKAYYNKGNSYFNEKKLKESIEAYKSSLRLNIEDKDAQKNLFLSKQLLKQEEQQQQENQDKNQENQDQENQDQENQDQENQDENQDENQENQDNQGENQENQDQKDQEKQGKGLDSLMQQEITKEELMKLLKAIEEEDKKIQQKLRRGTTNRKKSDKDW